MCSVVYLESYALWALLTTFWAFSINQNFWLAETWRDVTPCWGKKSVNKLVCCLISSSVHHSLATQYQIVYYTWLSATYTWWKSLLKLINRRKLTSATSTVSMISPTGHLPTSRMWQLDVCDESLQFVCVATSSSPCSSHTTRAAAGWQYIINLVVRR